MNINKPCFILLFLSAASFAQNPLFWGADPSALVAENGKVYIFPTNDKKEWGDQKEWYVWSSDDLKEWTNEGMIFNTKMSGWGIDNAWAPDATYKDGKYYFYYYFQNGDKPGGIGVAVADSPAGPYKDALGHRLMRGHDPAVFMDDDGTAFIYVQDKVYELNEDMVSLKNEKPIDLGLKYRPKKFEAAYVFERDSKYYFTIAKDFNNLIYYMGESPTGPFTYTGEIMKPYGGNNHHSIVNYKGDWIIFYHEWAPKESDTSNRRIRAEWLYFNDDGTIKLVEPTQEGISVPPKK